MQFQFNKTELQNIRKNLKIRQQALPTLKNKESALRAEIKRFRGRIKDLQTKLNERLRLADAVYPFFTTYENTLHVDRIKTRVQKIAGVKIPVFEGVDFSTESVSLFAQATWFLDAIDSLKEVLLLKMEIKIEEERIRILEYARKKTTQKVNLYEKVQIPSFEMAIIKIKRFLEDVDNLDRAGQKIIKKKKEREEQVSL